MTTYSKETALYDTGAIKNGIDDASTKASNFLSVDNSGIMVYDGSNGTQAPSSPSSTTKNVFIDSDSVDVRQGTTTLATFGATTTVGKTGSSDYNVSVNSNEIDFNKGASTLAKMKIAQPVSTTGQKFIFGGYSPSNSMYETVITPDVDDYISNSNTYRNPRIHLYKYNGSGNQELRSIDLACGKQYVQMDYQKDSVAGESSRMRFLADDSSNRAALFQFGVGGETERTLSIGVATGGTSHGIYSDALETWLIYFNESDQVVAPNVGAKTTTTSANVQVTSAGLMRRYTSSSKRYKKDIDDLKDKTLDEDKLYDIPVRQFKYKDGYITDEDDRRTDCLIPGFIAEEIDKIYPIAADYNEDGLVEDWNVRYLVPPMLKLIQKQHKEIEELKAEIAEIKEMLK